VGAQLPGNEELPGDRQLLVIQVAGEPDDLHPVAQWFGNRAEGVRRREEQHLRQVVVDFEIVVAEGAILFGIEHFEQRGRRIAAPVLSEFVHLIEEEHRVHHPGAAHRLDHAAGHRADVGAAVPADLCLVAHAAERHAREGAAQRPRDRPT